MVCQFFSAVSRLCISLLDSHLSDYGVMRVESRVKPQRPITKSQSFYFCFCGGSKLYTSLH